MGLLDLVRQRTEGRKREAGEPVPERCTPFTAAEGAAEIGCTTQELLADLKDGERRGLFEYAKVGTRYEVRLTCADPRSKTGIAPRAWEALASVPRGPQRVVEKPDAAEEPEQTEEERRRTATREQMKFRAREGRGASPVKKFDVPPSSLSVTIHGADAEITATREGTHCTLEIEVASSKVNHLAQKTESALVASPPRTFSRREPAEPSHAAGRAAARAGDSPIPSAEREALRDGLGLGADPAMVRTLYGILSAGGASAAEFVGFVDQKKRHRRKPVLKGLLPTLAKEFIDTAPEERVSKTKDRALELAEQMQAERMADQAARAARAARGGR